MRVAAPTDAVYVGESVDQNGDDAHWGHYVRGTRRGTAGVNVTGCGWQNADGTVARHVSARPTLNSAPRHSASSPFWCSMPPPNSGS